MVLEKDGEDPLDRSCVKRLRITYSEVGRKYQCINKKKEGSMNGSDLPRNFLPKQVFER